MIHTYKRSGMICNSCKESLIPTFITILNINVVCVALKKAEAMLIENNIKIVVTITLLTKTYI